MLPKVRNAVSIYQKETIPFLGLNRSDNTQEGEFSYQKNMSGRRYPFLAPRLPREGHTSGYIAPTALFSWDGREVLVDLGSIFLDGEEIGQIADGAKQFAVVNTKLIVWPDKIMVDLVNKQMKPLGARAENNGTATLTETSLTLDANPVHSVKTLRYKNYDERRPWIWTYSSVSWNGSSWTKGTGEWRTPDNAEGRYYIPAVNHNEDFDTYTVGDPATVFSANKPSDKPTEATTPTNSLGFYVKIGKSSSVIMKDYYSGEVSADVYWTEMENVPLGSLFSAGDVVSISGSLYGYQDTEAAKVLSVDEEENRINFEAGAIRTGLAIGETGAGCTNAACYCNYGSQWREITRVTIPAGMYAVLGEDYKLRIYDTKWSYIAGYETAERSSAPTTGYKITMTTLGEATSDKITVERKIPAMDFICERENRLCGVSNTDNTIYISSLGDPTNFYDYSGDQGGFAVAVGSEGDFTGICDYGNALLCWKERSLHKVLGDVPSNYQTGTYRFSGVRAGAHKSLVNVNETLFFLGVDGVYTYSGNKPALISKALGTDVLKEGVGGTDGRAYYLSAKNGETWELLNYDTHTGLWSRSDDTQVVDFCRIGDYVKYLSADTFIYTIGAGEESVEWEAVFCPMYETLEGGKQYNKLIFRVSVPKDGYLYADVRFDDGRWIQTGGVKGKTGAVQMAVPLRRCDKFEVRLRGKGDCCVMEMLREFRLRGER